MLASWARGVHPLGFSGLGDDPRAVRPTLPA